jgi:predicted MFS family arabinose efflux permease
MIAALGIVQICAWGTLFYSFPLVVEAMGAENGWTRPQLYGAATIGLGLAGVAAYPVGAMIDAGHGRAVMTAASLLSGLLLAAWSQVTGLVQFYVVFAALGCLQAAILYEPAFAVIARRLGARGVRRGITALTLWGGFASTVFIPLIQFLIDWFGWRGALLCLGAINALVCGSLCFLFIRPAPGPSQPAPALQRAASGRAAVVSAARLPAFWALLLALVAYAAAFSTLTFHLYPMLLERGLTAAAVVTVLAVVGPAQVAGRVAIWAVLKEAPIRLVGSAVVAVFPLAALGFAHAPAEILPLAIVAMFYGAANGIMTIVRGLCVPEMVSREAYGAINGALVAPMHVVQALAPLAAAWLWSLDGSYDGVLAAIFLCACVLALAFWAAAALARPYR